MSIRGTRQKNKQGMSECKHKNHLFVNPVLTGTLPGTLFAFILTSTTVPNSEEKKSCYRNRELIHF